MTSSSSFPYAEASFRNGQPIPNSPFSNWLRQESTLTPGSHIHPRPLALSTNWLDGSGSFINILFSAHSPIHLLKVLEKFVSKRGGYLTSVQRIGIESYKDERKDGHFGYIGPPEDESAMRRHYEYFNDIFSCGCLGGLCVIRFCNDSDHVGVEADSFGEAISPITGETHRQQIPDGYEALIKIKDQSNESPLLDEETRWQNHLSTLLHEMLHVFFGVYGCLCFAACRKVHADEIGRCGHRKSWQLAALAVEEATLPLLGELLDLSRKVSLEDDKDYVNTVNVQTKGRFGF
jgi:hypothetical protein